MSVQSSSLHGGDIYGDPDLATRIRDGRCLDFSVNTNPRGMPPAVVEALRNQAADFARYPDPHCRLLKSALASFEGTGADSVVCGSGAADILFRLCHCQKPRQVLVAVPAFTEYERAAREAGAAIQYHVLREDEGFILNRRFLDEIRPGIDMVFLANPNNPTGKTVPPDVLRETVRQCAAVGALLVIDECFLPFTDALPVDVLREKNVVAVKALTKTFCLAGLRLGYCLCADPKIAAALNSTGQYWNVSGPAQAAGIAALRCKDWFAESKKLIEEARPILAQGLCSLGLRVYESEANFLLFRLEKSLEPSLESRCLERGIMLRPCGNFPGLDSRYYRVAVKTAEENRVLLDALKRALDEP